MGPITARIAHNVTQQTAPDGTLVPAIFLRGMYGGPCFRPGDEFELVHSVTVEAGLANAGLRELCGELYVRYNADPFDEDSACYRAKRLRSLCAGDAVVFELPDGSSRAFAFDTSGVVPLDKLVVRGQRADVNE